VKAIFKGVIRWMLRGVALLLLLLLIDVSALAFPYLWFGHSQDLGNFTIYSDEPINLAIDDIIAQTNQRCEAMELYQPGMSYRVFVCHNPKLYALHTFLVGKGSNSQALVVSVVGNIFVNVEHIELFASQAGPEVRHSRYEGNYAEVLAHEMAHAYMGLELGFWAYRPLSVWKSKGYAEYSSNLAPIRADSTYRFEDRVALLFNDAYWGCSYGVARQLWEYTILVEYLCDVEGYEFTDIADEELIRQTAHEKLNVWWRNR